MGRHRKKNREHNNIITSQKRMALIPQRGKGHSVKGGSTVIKTENKQRNTENKQLEPAKKAVLQI